MIAPHTTWKLAHHHLGQTVLVFDRLESTNTLALQLGTSTHAAGWAILADEQTSGRGQHGRRWLAPPRSSVLLSVILYPPEALSRPVVLTALAAVSVSNLVQQLTSLSPRIKWPNDVLLGERKVCGILIEQRRLGSLPVTVLGIGLNVCQSNEDFSAAGLPEATSLLANGACVTDTHEVARQLLRILDEHYTCCYQTGLRALETRWRAYLDLVSHSVEVELLNGFQQGVLLDCAFDQILLQTTDQSCLPLAPESILHIRKR